MFGSRYTHALIYGILGVSGFVLGLSAQDTSRLSSDERIPSAAEIYRGFVNANGGRSNIMSLSTLVISGQMVYAEGQVNEFKLYRKRPGMIRMCWIKPGVNVEVAYDGEYAARRITYVANGERELQELSAAELEGLRHDSSMNSPFFTVGSNSDNILSIEHDSVRGVSAFRLEIDPSAEIPFETIWLDAETFQEIKLAQRVTSEESDVPMLVEVFLSDISQVEGVYFARKADYYHDGTFFKAVEIERIRANIGIFDSYFTLK